MKTSIKFWIASGASVIAWTLMELDEVAISRPNSPAPTSRMEAASPLGNASVPRRTETAYHTNRESSSDLNLANGPARRAEALAPSANDAVRRLTDTARAATRGSFDRSDANGAIDMTPLEQSKLAFIDTGDQELLHTYSRSIGEIVTLDEASRSIANSQVLQSQLAIINRNDDELLQQYALEAPFRLP